MRVLAHDKKLEADFGFRGAWSGHPLQNEVAMAQFPWPEQKFLRYPDVDRDPGRAAAELEASPAGHGRVTLQGTRDACRAMIEYAFNYLGGRGASLIEGRMEDLATFRIYVMMVVQRIRHGVVGEDSRERHSEELVRRLFDEELEKLVAARAGRVVGLPQGGGDGGEVDDTAVARRYAEARRAAEAKVSRILEDPIVDFRF